MAPRIRLVVLRSAGSPDAPDIKETFERHALAEGVSPEEFLAEASSGAPASPPADVVRGGRGRGHDGIGPRERDDGGDG